ncbi:MAG: hypothetical protein DVB31_10995 [Verrucomicrobia bacterium]|nr:MAG: hypothetical protein DVB31_10995 [Verrucomicrobiota bacterium]
MRRFPAGMGRWVIRVVAVAALARAGVPAFALAVATNPAPAARVAGGPAPGGTRVPSPPASTNAPIRDIHDAVEIPDPWRHAPRMAAAGLALGAAVAGTWLWLHRRKAAAAGAAPENPADIARRRLDAARAVWSDPRAFGIEVSAALREYLEARYGLRAPEQTTEEFLEDLRARPLLETRHQGVLAAFLEQCDLLKFAGARPGSGMAEQLLESGRRVVDETDPVPPVAAPAAPAKEASR